VEIYILRTDKALVMLQAMVYIHRVTNKHGVHDLLLDQWEDIADCEIVYVCKQGKQVYGRAKLWFDDKYYQLHHFIADDVPDGFEIDHIDGNPLNSTRCNLRVVSSQQIKYNTYTPNRKGFAGVEQMGNKFRARAYVNGVVKQIGSHDYPEEAAMIRGEVMDVIGHIQSHVQIT